MNAGINHRWPLSLRETLLALAAVGGALGWAVEHEKRVRLTHEVTVRQAINMLDQSDQICVECRMEGSTQRRYWLVRERAVSHPIPVFRPYTGLAVEQPTNSAPSESGSTH